jgi:hypothetical protein
VYYDRRLFPPLLESLAPAGGLGWLIPFLQSDWGGADGADLHFRGDRKGHGYFEVYCGRTGLLRVHSVSDGFVLKADASYERIAPSLFGKRLESLSSAESAIREYLDKTARNAALALVGGEGRLQAGLGRAHGLLASRHCHALLLDREIMWGHHGMEEKRRKNADVRGELGLGDREVAHDKLDGIALLEDGRIALVELKVAGGDLLHAALQLVAYRRRFTELARQWSTWASSGLGAILDQKQSLGLLPRDVVRPQNEIVPVIATADDRAGWSDFWRRAIEPARTSHPTALATLQFWRLDATGRIQEVVAA